MKTIERIEQLLGNEAKDLLEHKCATIDKSMLTLPGPDFVDRVTAISDRSIPVMRSMQALFDSGRLAGTGYLSILPVDQGIEHSAGASFAPNPIYFDPENIVKLAVEAGCNAVASTLGVLSSVARKYAHKIPFVVKINHNELLTYPNKHDQILFASVEQARDMGAVAVGASTSAATSPPARFRRSAAPSRSRTSSAWRPSCGATCATALSRPRRRTTTWRPTSRARGTTSA